MDLQVDREGAASDLCWHAVCKGLGRRTNHPSHCRENSPSPSLGPNPPAWSPFHRRWGTVMTEGFVQPAARCWTDLVTHMTLHHHSPVSDTSRTAQRCWFVGGCGAVDISVPKTPCQWQHSLYLLWVHYSTAIFLSQCLVISVALLDVINMISDWIKNNYISSGQKNWQHFGNFISETHKVLHYNLPTSLQNDQLIHQILFHFKNQRRPIKQNLIHTLFFNLSPFSGLSCSKSSQNTILFILILL